MGHLESPRWDRRITSMLLKHERGVCWHVAR